MQIGIYEAIIMWVSHCEGGLCVGGEQRRISNFVNIKVRILGEAGGNEAMQAHFSLALFHP